MTHYYGSHYGRCTQGRFGHDGSGPGVERGSDGVWQLSSYAAVREVLRDRDGSADLSELRMELSVEVASRVVGLTDSRCRGMARRIEALLSEGNVFADDGSGPPAPGGAGRPTPATDGRIPAHRCARR